MRRRSRPRRRTARSTKHPQPTSSAREFVANLAEQLAVRLQFDRDRAERRGDGVDFGV